MRVLLVILGTISLLSHVIRSQSSCTEFTDETSCISDGACQWVTNALSGSNGQCQCRSNVKLDILFALDASGSITRPGFQVLKEFLVDLVLQGINTQDARIGFVIFSTTVNFSRSIQPWETQELHDYISGITFIGVRTNTPQVITDSLLEFRGIRNGSIYTPDPDRQQVLIMVTDGNPCLSEAMGGCPQSVCQYASAIKILGIRVMIIGVGDDLTPEYVRCLCQNDDDYIPVANFSSGAFNSIVGSLSGVLCPVSKDFKVTEVKAMKKPTDWSDNGDGRYSRFVEIYNMGIEFNIQDIRISGLITMSNAPNITVSQGMYVVFYDANDAMYPSVVSCHLCGSDCDLSSCSFANTPNVGYCWCGNSIYIACGNTYDGNSCPIGSIPSLSTATAHDACDVCTFDDSMDRTHWNIQFIDDMSDALIDEVIYDADTWIETNDKHSYELRHKAYDNDFGGNWGQSCSPLGTPGADPAAACDAICIDNGCGGDNICLMSTGQCDCDPNTGYYPQCTSATSCTKCALIPQVNECEVYWTRNGTELTATYTWSSADGDQSTRYVLSSFAGSKQGNIKMVGQKGSHDIDDCPTCIWEPIYETSDFYPGNSTFGGYVQVAIDECVLHTNGQQLCDVYLGQATWCVIRTEAPTTTIAATTTTTNPPSTTSQTPQPTAQCPLYYWIGGTQQQICLSNDRCNCVFGAKECCLVEPIFMDSTYDANRRHHTKFDCKLDVEKHHADEEDEDEAGTSPGYLLTETDHYFSIAILPNDYGCMMDIYWKLEWIRTDCYYEYEGNRRRLQDCDEDSTSLSQAGLEIDVTDGWLKVWGANDEQNATVKFNVRRRECAFDDGSLCYSGIAMYGRLVIVNATSQCGVNCFDGRIYPMSIPVWFNYEGVESVVPGREKALGAWLWWLIAAMAIFVAILIVLVYKYWWLSQKTGSALKTTQKDLDVAINEDEYGFGAGLKEHHIDFNPLSTAIKPNATTNYNVPNGPPQHDGNMTKFVIPMVERPIERKQYGPVMGVLK